MLSWEDDVEAHALRRRGWSISAIARHLGHDRKTVRAYLRGERKPGRRASRGPDVMARYVEYCRIRLADDPHLWASGLLDELRELGYQGSYPSLTAAIRAHRLRPHCEPCQASAGRDVAVIAHPPGEETQFDWLELPGPPPVADHKCPLSDNRASGRACPASLFPKTASLPGGGAGAREPAQPAAPRPAGRSPDPARPGCSGRKASMISHRTAAATLSRWPRRPLAVLLVVAAGVLLAGLPQAAHAATTGDFEIAGLPAGVIESLP